MTPIWPVLQCDNIFVLPGVPKFFEAKMKLITQHFVKSNNNTGVYMYVYLNIDVYVYNYTYIYESLITQHFM
jgi:molybdopterin-biosynthesis enzyme MoeA-like protein